MDLLQIIKIFTNSKIVQNWVHFFGHSKKFLLFALIAFCFYTIVQFCPETLCSLYSCAFLFFFSPFLDPAEVKLIGFPAHCWAGRLTSHHTKQDALFSAISHATPFQLMVCLEDYFFVKDSEHLICIHQRYLDQISFSPLTLVQDPEWFYRSHLSLLQIYTTAAELWFCLLCEKLALMPEISWIQSMFIGLGGNKAEDLNSLRAALQARWRVKSLGNFPLKWFQQQHFLGAILGGMLIKRMAIKEGVKSGSGEGRRGELDLAAVPASEGVPALSLAGWEG